MRIERRSPQGLDPRPPAGWRGSVFDVSHGMFNNTMAPRLLLRRKGVINANGSTELREALCSEGHAVVGDEVDRLRVEAQPTFGKGFDHVFRILGLHD